MKRLGKRPTVVVYSLDHETWACAAIRILAPLLANNWNVIWGTKQNCIDISFEIDIARRADLIIIQRHFPAEFTERTLKAIIKLGVPIAYDLDDNFLDIPTFHPYYNELKKRIPYIKWILKEADIITVSTSIMKEAVNKYTSRPVYIQPNLVSWDLFYAQPRIRNNQFNFLISGTPTHKRDWDIIEDALSKILSIYEKGVGVIFYGGLPEKFLHHPSVKSLNFQENYKSYAEFLRELNVHVALIPLENTTFNKCKSNIKWLEYSAAGILGIFSNIEPYSTTISNGETGLLVENTTDAWFRGMEEVIKNQQANSAMIKNAQHKVQNEYAVDKLSAQYIATFSDVLKKEHQHSVFAELSILPACIQNKAYQTINKISSLLNKHIMWRVNQKY